MITLMNDVCERVCVRTSGLQEGVEVLIGGLTYIWSAGRGGSPHWWALFLHKAITYQLFNSKMETLQYVI